MVCLVAGLGLAAGGTALSTYSGSAAAYGLDLTVANESIPLLPEVELAGPTSQASLDTLGNSDAYASFPYPGSTAAGLTGLLSAIYGVQLPSYPFSASTSQVPETSDQNFPGIALHAESQASSASAATTVGAGSSSYVASAEVVDDQVADHGVDATAKAMFSGIGIGGVLMLIGVDSQASADTTGSGSVVTSSGLSIGRITVPGLSIQIPATTPGTVPLPDPIPGAPQLPVLKLPAIPLPSGGETLIAPDLGFEDGYFTVTIPKLGTRSFALPSGPVLSALEAVGITATFESASNITDSEGNVIGVVAPALNLSMVVPTLPKNNLFNGPTTVTMTIGRSTASVGNVSVGSQTPAAAGPATSPAASGGGLTNNTAITSNAGTISSISASPNTVPMTSGPEGSISTAGKAHPVPQGSIAYEAMSLRSVRSIYFVLIGVAVIGLLAAAALRALGVKRL